MDQGSALLSKEPPRRCHHNQVCVFLYQKLRKITLLQANFNQYAHPGTIYRAEDNSLFMWKTGVLLPIIVPSAGIKDSNQTAKIWSLMEAFPNRTCNEYNNTSFLATSLIFCVYNLNVVSLNGHNSVDVSILRFHFTLSCCKLKYYHQFSCLFFALTDRSSIWLIEALFFISFVQNYEEIANTFYMFLHVCQYNGSVL